MMDRLDLDLEIRSLVIGPPNERTFVDALLHIESRIRGGFQGWQYEARVPMVLGVNSSPAELPLISDQQLVAWGAAKGFIVARLGPPSGSLETPGIRSYSGMGIAAIDATTLDQVDNSIRAARDQVPPDGLSILVLTLSLAGSAQLGPKQTSYINILSHALERRVWGGDRNKRFGAIALKLSPVEIETSCGMWKYTSSGGLHTHVTQPRLGLAKDLNLAELVDELAKLSRPT